MSGITGKSDITDRQDLMRLLQHFYQRLLADPSINYIFTDVAKIDLEHHLPVLVDFWDMVLFQHDTYRKNAMQPHLDLNHKHPFTQAHFDTWLHHFNASVDALFEGEVAFVAKQRALSIATTMRIKMMQA